MSEIWFTSDLHLAHDKEFLYKPRGFANPREHAETVIELINDLVAPQDELYILGDLVLSDINKGMEYLDAIRCRNVNFIIGNHDTDKKIEQYLDLGFTCLGYATTLKVGKKHFYLSHYPTATQNWQDDKKPWERVLNLCGHTHTKDKWDPVTGSYHVELDAHYNCPVNLDKIVEHYKMRCETI